MWNVVPRRCGAPDAAILHFDKLANRRARLPLIPDVTSHTIKKVIHFKKKTTFHRIFMYFATRKEKKVAGVPESPKKEKNNWLL